MTIPPSRPSRAARHEHTAIAIARIAAERAFRLIWIRLSSIAILHPMLYWPHQTGTMKKTGARSAKRALWLGCLALVTACAPRGSRTTLTIVQGSDILTLDPNSKF